MTVETLDGPARSRTVRMHGRIDAAEAFYTPRQADCSMAGSGSLARARIAMLLSCMMLLAADLAPLGSTAEEQAPLSVFEEAADEAAWAPKATTTWTGVVTLTSDYIVAVTDELRVQSGTIVEMGPSVRIKVAGRLTILGTDPQPVSLRSIVSSQRHEGIQFNASSNGRGSSIQHLDISQGWFGITIYDSDPNISNVSIDDADYVGIDIFGGSPIIRDITIQDGGQGVHTFATHWRYGIGLSIGAQAAPFVTNVTIDNVMTRGLNFWGGSGGMFSDLHLTNVTGATQAIAAGIWVQDSIPLIVDADIDRSDNGVYVRHIDENHTTRPAFRELTVENSMYNGVFVERYNKSMPPNFLIPLNAVFLNLTIRGTGGPGAKAPDLCMTAFGINTSGVDIDGALIENNECNGLKAYMIDSSTIMNNVTVIDSGEDDVSFASNDRAGVFMRSVNWAPMITELNVSGSPGHGILLWKASLRGSDWRSDDNGGTGLAIRESHPELNGFEVSDNALQGVWVYDSSNVRLENVSSRGNGASAAVGEGYGFHFEKSNDVMSDGKNVSCIRCSSENDTHGGLWFEDSIDLQILGFTNIGATGAGPAIQGGNGGLSQQGHVILRDLYLIQDAAAVPVLYFDEVDAEIHNLTVAGEHSGVLWDAIGNFDSRLDGAVLNGSDCLTLTEHQQFIGTDIDLSDCTGSVELTRGTYNFSAASGAQNLTFNQAGLTQSVVNWISSGPPPAHAFGVTDRFDVLWMVDLWTVNQRLNGLPNALANLSFDQFNGDLALTMPYSGNTLLGPFVGQRRTLSGNSPTTEMWVGCDYDAVHNDTGPSVLDTDMMVICRLELSNQPPFLNWTTPLDGEVFASGGEVLFNATASWDLDGDYLIGNWTSSIDGNLLAACSGQGIGQGGMQEGTLLTVNYQAGGGGGVCPLSDGVHDITFELCDDQGNCVNETRQIELRNLPPSIDISLYPPPDALGVIRLGRMEMLHINSSGTTDPEGDALLTSVFTSLGAGWPDQPPACTPPDCPLEWNVSFGAVDENIDSFDLNVTFSDAVNPVVELVWAVELYNELPVPSLMVNRTGNLSKDTVTLDASGTVDSEGDAIRARWSSDMIGQLPAPSGDPLVWVGQLPAGRHVITLEVSDDDSSHLFFWAATGEVVLVENTPPHATIASPANGSSADSATLLEFTAGAGSGDWDLGCVVDPPIALWCDPAPLGQEDIVSAVWSSHQMTEPIGSGWSIGARLQAGDHIITLTVDDGQGTPAISSVQVSVAPSAPLLVVDSPIEGIEVFSDGPVLFDFRRSWDPDGDEFTVTITSDHPAVDMPIVEAGTIDFWYNDWLPAGLHNLTFNLTDSTGASRQVVQSLRVGETGPTAVISGVVEGQYIGPGVNISLVGSDSIDYDDDIVLYEWTLYGTTTSEVMGTSVNWTSVLPPGEQRIGLRVVDSRGVDSTSMVNLTVGISNPTLRSLQVIPSILTSGFSELVTVNVILEDADGTTEIVRARISHSGDSQMFDLFDDGNSGDEKAGDGIWTGRVRFTAVGSGWARVEAWAEDGEMVSPTVKVDIEVQGGSDAVSFITDLASNGLGLALGLLLLLLLAGVAVLVKRRRDLKRDLDLIESWGSAGFAGVDPELDSGSAGPATAGAGTLDWDEPENSPTQETADDVDSYGKARDADIPSFDDLGR